MLMLTPFQTILCSAFAWKAFNLASESPWTVSGSQFNSSCYLSVPNETAQTINDFKSYLAEQYAAGTPVTIAYKLATPNPITTTPFSLPALTGTNTVYTDGDAVEVAGRADPNHTIDALNQRIAALENKEVS